MDNCFYTKKRVFLGPLKYINGENNVFYKTNKLPQPTRFICVKGEWITRLEKTS